MKECYVPVGLREASRGQPFSLGAIMVSPLLQLSGAISPGGTMEEQLLGALELVKERLALSGCSCDDVLFAQIMVANDPWSRVSSDIAASGIYASLNDLYVRFMRESGVGDYMPARAAFSPYSLPKGSLGEVVFLAKMEQPFVA